ISSPFGIAGYASKQISAVDPLSVTVVSAASYEAKAIAPEAMVAAFGAQLATQTVAATTIPLPTLLGGTTIEINGRKAELFFVSSHQVNFVIPAQTEIGVANVVVRAGDGTVSTGTVQVTAVAPAIFTANGDGQGVPTSYLVRVKPD